MPLGRRYYAIIDAARTAPTQVLLHRVTLCLYDGGDCCCRLKTHPALSDLTIFYCSMLPFPIDILFV